MMPSGKDRRNVEILKADLGVSKMVQQAKASASKPPDT